MNKRKIRALKLFLYCIAIAVSIFALYTFIFIFDNGLGWKIFLIIVGIGWLISAISGFIETLSNKHSYVLRDSSGLIQEILTVIE